MGVPDEDYGQRLVAFVVPQRDADFDEESVRKVPERQSISIRATPGHQDRGEDSPQSDGQGRPERADALMGAFKLPLDGGVIYLHRGFRFGRAPFSSCQGSPDQNLRQCL